MMNHDGKALARKMGANIRKYREQRGMSQLQLACSALLEQRDVYQYEHGMMMPQMLRLVRIADALGVSLDALAGRESNGK